MGKQKKREDFGLQDFAHWNISNISTYTYNWIWEDVNIIYKLFAFSLLFTHKPLLLSLDSSQKSNNRTTIEQVSHYCLFLPQIWNTFSFNSSIGLT